MCCLSHQNKDFRFGQRSANALLGQRTSASSWRVSAAGHQVFRYFSHRDDLQPFGFPLGRVSAQGRLLPNPLFKPDCLRQPV